MSDITEAPELPQLDVSFVSAYIKSVRGNNGMPSDIEESVRLVREAMNFELNIQCRISGYPDIKNVKMAVLNASVNRSSSILDDHVPVDPKVMEHIGFIRDHLIGTPNTERIRDNIEYQLASIARIMFILGVIIPNMSGDDNIFGISIGEDIISTDTIDN